MDLLILRHAHAEPHRENDAIRALTKKGIAQAQKLGEFCKRHEIFPEYLLTSPLVRALQTAKEVAKVLKLTESLRTENFLRSGMSPDVALDQLQRYVSCSSVMIVGHEPDLSFLIGILIGCGVEGVQIKKATLTKISLPKLEPGLGTLEYLVPVGLL
jgi:phosphohistidine phosphatase